MNLDPIAMTRLGVSIGYDTDNIVRAPRGRGMMRWRSGSPRRARRRLPADAPPWAQAADHPVRHLAGWVVLVPASRRKSTRRRHPSRSWPRTGSRRGDHVLVGALDAGAFLITRFG
jgi:hypothetical protein